jgi:hypothetical protein
MEARDLYLLMQQHIAECQRLLRDNDPVEAYGRMAKLAHEFFVVAHYELREDE